MTPSQNLSAVATLALLIAVGFGVGYKIANDNASVDADAVVQITRTALTKAKAAKDSLLVAHAKRIHQDSISWTNYVQQVRASGHDSLQEALRRLAVRRGTEVSLRIPDSKLRTPFPGDIPSNRDSTCSVELPCSYAADLLASDSLRSTRIDSLADASVEAVAACSTAVLSERLRGDSLAAQQPRKATWKDRASDAAVGAGLMATIFAILGIVW